MNRHLNVDDDTLELILVGLEAKYPAAVGLIRQHFSRHVWRQFEEWTGAWRRVTWWGMSDGHPLLFNGSPKDHGWPWTPKDEPNLWWCDMPPLPGEAKLQ